MTFTTLTPSILARIIAICQTSIPEYPILQSSTYHETQEKNVQDFLGVMNESETAFIYGHTAFAHLPEMKTLIERNELSDFDTIWYSSLHATTVANHGTEVLSDLLDEIKLQGYTHVIYLAGATDQDAIDRGKAFGTLLDQITLQSDNSTVVVLYEL